MNTPMILALAMSAYGGLLCVPVDAGAGSRSSPIISQSDSGDRPDRTGDRFDQSGKSRRSFGSGGGSALIGTFGGNQRPNHGGHGQDNPPGNPLRGNNDDSSYDDSGAPGATSTLVFGAHSIDGDDHEGDDDDGDDGDGDDDDGDEHEGDDGDDGDDHEGDDGDGDDDDGDDGDDGDDDGDGDDDDLPGLSDHTDDDCSKPEDLCTPDHWDFQHPPQDCPDGTPRAVPAPGAMLLGLLGLGFVAKPKRFAARVV